MQVINRHHLKTAGWPEGALYVGRGTVLGNPFEIGKDGSREEVVARFSVWLDERVAAGDAAVLTALVGAQRASALVCSCAPAPCHATRIAEVAPTIRLHGLPPSRCYAGIGSRNTPPEVLAIMARIAARLALRGYTLRSGGADGADTAFEEGAGTAKEVFLPWPGFNGRDSPYPTPSANAYRVASALHPAWARLEAGPQALHARNSHQILGAELGTPVDFVVCWTPDGCESEKTRSTKTGGTGQAIALADRWGIPVFNLAGAGALDRIGAFLDKQNENTA